VNVTGTKNVIQACKEAGVRRIVYSSTMDVVCWRNKPTTAARDAELSIPPRREDFLYGDYAITKAEVRFRGWRECILIVERRSALTWSLFMGPHHCARRRRRRWPRPMAMASIL
jgi:hypothetical protein